MRIKSGHIPADIVYIFGGKQDINTKYWDDVEMNEEETLQKLSVTPAFVADADNKKTIATGEAWANKSCQKYDYDLKKYVEIAVLQKSVRENTPMKKIRIVSYEHRGESGRVYKVVTEDGFYFDLREDVLLETMITKGIEPGGYMAGTYIWARVAGTMKIVRVGSELYNALLAAGERAILSTIPRSQLIPGAVYETKSGGQGIFLGEVTGVHFKLNWPNKKSTWHNIHHSYRLAKTQQPTLTAEPFKKQMLWLLISPYTVSEKNYSAQNCLTKALNVPEPHSFTLMSTHNFVKKLQVLPGVPAPGLVADVRKIAVKDLASVRASFQTPTTAPLGYFRTTAYEEVSRICDKTPLCFMRDIGTDPIDTNIPEMGCLNNHIDQEAPEFP